MQPSPRTIRALGWSWLTIGLFALPVTLYATALGEVAAARGLGTCALIGIFAGGGCLAATLGLDRRVRAPAALRLLILGWMTGPLVAAPSFGAVSDGWVEAVFEAVSALTTTGATLTDPDTMPRSLVVWRSMLQWLGGLATLVLAVTVLAGLDDRRAGLRRSSLLTIESGDLFSNLGRALIRLGGVYAGITVIGFLALAFAGASSFEALNLSLSGISTGGYLPRGGELTEWLPGPAIAVLAALCVLGAGNMAVLYEHVSRGRVTRRFGDVRAMLILSVACGVTVAIAVSPAAGLAGFFDALFAVTTAGYSVSPEGAGLPAIALLTLALAGGAAVSTSGGIKMARLRLLLKRAGRDILLLVQPSSVGDSRFAGRAVNEAALVSVWAYALAYPVVLALGALALGPFAADMGLAWSVAGAALTNAGPIAGQAYGDVGSGGLIIASILMILGRIEILPFAAVLFLLFSGD
ncbi:TrkH family potassium uptake protein [Synechococcus moorigangaii CMS01]|nr:TrkH family potassium uptake protein [Synechococcus moorigangaii CMS01]